LFTNRSNLFIYGISHQRGDVPLFEKISLEGAQSGLSWLTILRKRSAYRRVFFDFDIARVAAMTQEDVDRIIEEDGENKRNIIVRHRGKIEAVINNAKCIQHMRINDEKEEATDNGVFDKFLWSFVQDQPILKKLNDSPSQSPESQAMSKALKKHGFRFVGPTTCYAMMQSVGMAIDHPVDSEEWKDAYERLQSRPGGYQER
jgi:DNA-3-methyladenine glycosylase I